jgi:membrane-associated phospholipid phosphatase
VKKLLQHNKTYFIAYLLLFSVALVIQFSYSKTDISIFVNSHYSDFLDFVCQYGTYMGDGLFVLVASMFLSFNNKKLGFASVFAYTISSLTVQGLKHLVFDDRNRPSKFLDMNQMHVLPGVEIHHFNSFPSGHTAAAFAFFTMLALFYQKPAFQILCLLLAIFAAYTRIYLLQHFFQDTLVGSAIGVATSVLVYEWLIEKNKIAAITSKIR